MRRLVVSIALVTACTRADPRVSPDPAASSPASTETGLAAVGAPSPEEAWTRLLAAMRDGDDEAIARLTTAAGLASLEHGVIDEPRATAYARWGAGWAKWSIRWRTRTADRAEAALGPEPKEHGLRFVRTAEGWKLDRWTPGE